MILDAQNLHTFSQAVKLQVCKLRSVSFRHHFLLCSRAVHVKLEVLSSLGLSRCFVFLATNVAPLCPCL